MRLGVKTNKFLIEKIARRAIDTEIKWERQPGVLKECLHASKLTIGKFSYLILHREDLRYSIKTPLGQFLEAFKQNYIQNSAEKIFK